MPEPPPSLQHLHDPPADDRLRGQPVDAGAGVGDRSVPDAPVLGPEQPRDRPEGRGLAGAVRAEERDDPAARNAERHALEDLDHVMVDDLDIVDEEGPALGPPGGRRCGGGPGSRRRPGGGGLRSRHCDGRKKAVICLNCFALTSARSSLRPSAPFRSPDAKVIRAVSPWVTMRKLVSAFPIDARSSAAARFSTSTQTFAWTIPWV